MQRVIFVRMKRLIAAACALAVGACAGSGAPEAAPADSAVVQLHPDSVAVQAIQAESLTAAPATTSPSRPARTADPDPTRLQPPPPRDTRPSIPYPPDTI